MADGYSVAGYGRMVADETRVRAYARALEAVVRPGCTVLDIGTGTGVFAMHAARLGARRVYAVEPASAIDTARELARLNGLADRIEFHQELSLRVSLPERVDVIVADLRGVLPPFRQIVATMADARERFLAPGGAIVPRRDTLFAAPVEAEATWSEHAGPASVLGFDYRPARRFALARWTRGLFRADQLLGEPLEWGALDYRVAAGPDFGATLEWTVARPGTAHGLAAWFSSDLAEGVGFHTGPDSVTVYETALFPWPEPVALAAGDRVRATLGARMAGDDYVYGWDTAIERAGGPPLSFRQSDFAGRFPSLAVLRRRADAFVPAPGDEGEVDAFALASMDGRASVGEIARAVMERFPGRFESWEAAVSRVGTLSDRYSA
ncbi:MAG TPA: 50S ribosomal protein L11 methyltransferase [Longimicrobium sp.]|jgi:protein arginine N-methyltransferase 1|nr:50S ribosomal protein L11 methyltransferase [Longimicrobium sp.]